MVLEVFLEAYKDILNTLPVNLRIFPPLIIFSIIIAIYSIFIFVFYKFLAKRDILKLDLKKYNIFEHAFFVKFFAVIFYIVEFVIIIPFVITFWFSVLSILLIVLAKEQPVEIMLLVSASIIGAIRFTAYYKEDLSRDLAKMFPFTLLGVALLTPGFFDMSTTVARLSALAPLFTSLIYYAIFIAGVEVLLRLLYIAYSSISSNGNFSDDDSSEE